MPYQNEFASKISHERIINLSEVAQKLKTFKVVYDCPAEEASVLTTTFAPVDDLSSATREIQYIFTVDSSQYELPVNDAIPSAKVGIVTFSGLIVNLNERSNLVRNGFINPQKFNDLYESSFMVFVTPSHNVIVKNTGRSLDNLQSIRWEIFNFFKKTPFKEISFLETLRTVLLEGGKDSKASFDCPDPDCKTRIEWDLENNASDAMLSCPSCGEQVYLSDWLRLHEAIDLEFGTGSILTRFSQAVEHLTILNFIQHLMKITVLKSEISRTAFIIDGPLALYGEPARLHKYILSYLHKVKYMIGQPLVYFGLQKSGRVKDHFSLLEVRLKEQGKEIEPNSYRIVDDDYRFRYIQRRPVSNKYFGQEVLYGQDFMFYSGDKKKYIVSVLYPSEEKNDKSFEKFFDPNSYSTLRTIFHLLNMIGTDAYEDAVLPVALAHRYAAVSLDPGTKVLEIFAKQYTGM
jgi:hypothetical protein